MKRASLFFVLCAAGCLVTKPIGSADTDATTGSTSGDAEPSSGPGMTSMVDVTGEPDDDPLRVDCAEADWGPTVGGGELSPLGFPTMGCNPRTSGSANGYQCCSTDPATVDGALPSYEGKPVTGGAPPLYADAANGAGTWGACVRTADLPQGSTLIAPGAERCPIPCNPTWADPDIATVCGAGRVCCQVHEVGANDCVQEDGVWRAVDGDDIGSVDVTPSTNWNNVAHDTHQDPNGTVCLAAAGGDPNSEVFRACIRQLSVADQRGFCMSLGPGQACPSDPDPPPQGAGYRNVCDLMNG